MNYIGLQGDRKTLPMIVVDIGYSKDQASCGIASAKLKTPQELQFGQAIKQTGDLIAECGSSVLVLEAVLSTFHQGNGNPDIRGEFERGRGWYYGPGVTTLVAALRFLRELGKSDHNAVDVYLAEAFLSFKKSKSRHIDDAQRICDDFWNTTPENLVTGTEAAVSFISGIPSVRVFKTE